MIVKKIIETSIDLLLPSEIYSTDVDQLILEKLKKRYLNICYQSILITKIVEVIQRSAVRIVNNRLDGGAFVDVRFKAEGIIYLEKEIINGCKVSEIRGKNIILEHKYATIMIQDLNNKNIYQTLNINHIVPIIVSKCKYSLSQKNMTITGALYTPQVRQNIVFIINNGLDAYELQKFKIVTQEIEAKEKQLDLLKDRKLFDYFQNLLYPFKVNQKYEQSDMAKKYQLQPINVTVDAMNTLNSGAIIFPCEDHFKHRRVFYTKKTQDLDQLGDMVISNGLYYILTQYLSKYINYLDPLIEFLLIYDSDKGPTEAYKALKTYWGLCENLKQ